MPQYIYTCTCTNNSTKILVGDLGIELTYITPIISMWKRNVCPKIHISDQDMHIYTHTHTSI